MSTSNNIKSKQTRNAVKESLTYIIRDLQNRKKMLDNGIAYFVGVALSPSGNEEFISEIIIPSLPIKKSNYICDKHFHPEEIMKLHNCYEDYGVVYVSGEYTKYYIVNGDNVNEIDKITIHRQKNQKNGGQSSGRFMRIRENQIIEYTKLIVNNINKLYKNEDGMCSVKEIIISGDADIKNEIPTHPELQVNLKNKTSKQTFILTTHTDDDIISLISMVTNKSIEGLMKVYKMIYDDFVQGKIDNIIYCDDELLRQAITTHRLKYLIISEQKAQEYGKPLLDEINRSGKYYVVSKNNDEIYDFVANKGMYMGVTLY